MMMVVTVGGIMMVVTNTQHVVQPLRSQEPPRQKHNIGCAI